jgi:hypothetical protein
MTRKGKKIGASKFILEKLSKKFKNKFRDRELEFYVPWFKSFVNKLLSVKRLALFFFCFKSCFILFLFQLKTSHTKNHIFFASIEHSPINYFKISP